MLKRVVLIFVFAATVALPFLLRPQRAARERADETVVIVTPHNEALRYEFGRGFRDWYRRKTGKIVDVDWRVIGGTSETARFLEGEYTAAFRVYWTRTLGRSWSADVQAGFQNDRLPADAPRDVREAREAFLASNVGCGLDVFFGGGTPDFARQAQAGRLVDSGIRQRHPEWFRDEVIPDEFSGERYRDPEGLWIGSVVSNYGIIANRDVLARLRPGEPLRDWEDLKDPRLVGTVALADPTKSGSIAKAFENVIQQQMQKRLLALRVDEPTSNEREMEQRAVREGWIEGLRLMQLISANARYFTDASQKPPIDVAQGNSSAGICIDFYGRQQDEALRRRTGKSRVEFITPVGGTVNSVDPIALFRGAKNRTVAEAFIEYVLSMDGQKLWNFRPGTPGGTERFALRRLPIRRDFYEQADFKSWRSDPEENPYGHAEQLVYRRAWTGGLFRESSFIIRVMCIDTHEELTAAWRAILAAGKPEDALAALQDLSAVDYEAAGGRIKRVLGSKNKVEEIRLARELGERFRAQYRQAETLARAKLEAR